MVNYMSSRTHCDELLSILSTMEAGFRSPLEGISQDHLNHVFAEHKMTIGQIAIHHTAWSQYFMALPNDKPWEVVPWTCRPCEYPLSLEFINSVMDDGFNALRDKLEHINDDLLEIDEEGNKGPGYIIYRLQMHAIAHSNQMSYLRQLLDPEWKFGTHFGDMATALIGLSYKTTRDLRIQGF